jgi:hypothetical protein
MQKRAFKRIRSNIKVKFSCCDIHYDGIITNLSENGMFINTSGMSFPFDSELEILIHLENMMLKVPVKVSRMTKSRDCYDGMGVELLNPPQRYLEFINSLRTTL